MPNPARSASRPGFPKSVLRNVRLRNSFPKRDVVVAERRIALSELFLLRTTRFSVLALSCFCSVIGGAVFSLLS